MLGKTAGGLFWMSRYLERSENTARMLETGQRIGLTRNSETNEDWLSILQAAATDQGYLAKYDEVTKETAIDWMLRDKDNGSSVLSSIAAARSNARLVRTAVTLECWEAVNSSWMALREAMKRRISERELPHVIGLIRQHSAQVRGAIHGTMLRNDIYDFCRIGTFMERADNTARILDVKYYVLLPSASAVGSSLDNVQWHTILRSVGSEGGYRITYGMNVEPSKIARHLILDPRMPRSLIFCVGKLSDNLVYLAEDYGQRMDCHDMAAQLKHSVKDRDIDEIFEYGLHEFIQDFLNGLSSLGRQIEIDYRFHA